MKIDEVNLKELIESETGQRFNRVNNICCPFHNEKTPSFHYYKDSNKYYCHGCGVGGDAIDFLREYKNMKYIDACNYLNIETNDKYKKIYAEEEKIKSFISWQLSKIEEMKDWNLIKLYRYCDRDNQTLYYRARFKTPDGKDFKVYSFDPEGKVKAKRFSDEVPYNYYNVLKAVEKNRTIYFAEGEKDVETLTNLGVTATSIKGVKTTFEWDYFKHLKIAVVGDTGKAGTEYTNFIKKMLFDSSSSYKEVRLKGLSKLGDNKDVTDWIEAGYTKEDFFECVESSLDLKNDALLQQNDFRGVYKTVRKFDKEGNEKEKDIVSITNFNIKTANTFTNLDTGENRIDLDIFSKRHSKTVSGEYKMFVDPKAFETSIDSMHHSFIGTRPDLLKLKEWIARYFIEEETEVYRQSGIREINGELVYITNNGALKADGTIDSNLNVDVDTFNTDLNGLSDITHNELMQLMDPLFNFNDKRIVYNCLGSEIVKLFNSFYKETPNLDMHVSAYLGESNSGKTFTYKMVVKPLLNIDYKAMTCGGATIFNLRKNSSESITSPVVLDEHTLSKGLKKKKEDINNFLTELTGDYNFTRHSNIKTKHSFNLTSTLILIGETLPTETSMINRCNIMWFSKAITEANPEYKTNIDWLADNEILLKKLGFSIKKHILKNYNKEKFIETIELIKECFPSNLKSREYNTFINTMLGLKVLYDVIQEISIFDITEDNFDLYGAAKIVERNIIDNVCAGGVSSKSDYENVLELIDEIVDTSDTNFDDPVKIREGFEFSYSRCNKYLQLDVKAIYPKLYAYIKRHRQNDFSIMDNEEFIKKLTSSIYIKEGTNRDYYVPRKLNNKSRKVFLLKKDTLRNLNLQNLVPGFIPTETTVSEDEAATDLID